MVTLLIILLIIFCIALGLFILIQNPKGGGLSSTLGGSQQMGGVQKTTDFLDKSTWTLGVLLIILIMFSSISFNGTNSEVKILDDSTPAPAKTEVPAPATTHNDAKPATEVPAK